MAPALAVAPYEPLIAEALLEQYDESGVNASDEWRREISRAWARVGKEELPKPSNVALKYRFDRASPTATKWAKNEAASLVTDITYQQQKAMREVVTRAFTEGRTSGQTASALGQILQGINPTGEVGQMLASQYAINANGLTPMYANAVARSAQGHAEALLAQGVTGTKALEAVQKKSQRYADKLRRSRAKMISRTEIMRASNQGRLEAAHQAAQKGLIDPAAARRQWMASPMDACPICTDLNGAIVALNQSWYAGEPPAHPSCRCTWLLVPNINVQAPPSFGGAGTGSDPFKWTFPSPMKVGDDFLPGAPLVEPVPAAAPPVAPTVAEALESGLMTGDEYVEMKLAAAAKEATKEGKLPIQVLEDALVTQADGSIIVDLGKVIDLDVMLPSQSAGYRQVVQLPPRLRSLYLPPSEAKKPWYDLLWSVKKDYVKKGYLSQAQADDLVLAIEALRDAATDVTGELLTWGDDLLEFWRALAHISDTLDYQVRAAVQAGAKAPQVNSALGKFLARQKATRVWLADNGLAHQVQAILDEPIVSWFGGSGPWKELLPEIGVAPAPGVAPSVAGHAEPAWWQQALDEEGVHIFWDDLPASAQQEIIDLGGVDSGMWMHQGHGWLQEIIEEAADLELEESALALLQPAKDKAAKVGQSFFENVEPSAGGGAKFIESIVEAGSTTTPGRIRISNLVKLELGVDNVPSMILEQMPAVYDDLVLPLGMRGLSPKDFETGRIAIRKLLKEEYLVTTIDKQAVAQLEEALSFLGKRFDELAKLADAIPSAEMGDDLVKLLDGLVQLNSRLASVIDEALAPLNGNLAALGSTKTRLRRWYQAFDESRATYSAEIGAIDELTLGGLMNVAEDFPPGFPTPPAGGPPPAPAAPAAAAPTPPSAATPKKPAPVTAQPLEDALKPSMPEEPPFDTKRLIEDRAATAGLGGQHPKRVFTDPDTGQQWIFKPQAQWQAEADRATAELQRRLGLQGAETYVVKVDGQIGSIQQVLGGTLDDSVSIFAGKTFDATKLSTAQMGRMQQNQMLDFLFSNYDAHSDNFLRLRQAADAGMLPIAIDKGQAFKHFGKAGEADGLVNFLFNPNSNAPSRNPYGVMLSQFSEGKGVAYNWVEDSVELQRFIVTARQLADSGDLAKILRPYAEEALAAGTLPAKSVDEFIEAVVARWRTLGDEVARLEEKLLQTAGGAIRAEQLALAERVADLGLKESDQFGVVTPNWAEQQLKPVTDALTETERSAVQRYTGNYYVRLNEALRDSKGVKSGTLNTADARTIKNLNNSRFNWNSIQFSSTSNRNESARGGGMVGTATKWTCYPVIFAIICVISVKNTPSWIFPNACRQVHRRG